MRFLGQLIKLPMAAITYSMEMFARTLQGLQRIADQSIDVVLNGTSQILGGLPSSAPDSSIAANEVDTIKAIATPDDTPSKEERRMPDTNLNDDMLKLVRYKILFVKRDYEHAFGEVEELVKENTTATAYAGWKIAEFIQHLDERNTPLPKKWKEKDYPSEAKHKSGDWLLGLPDGDKKYLRVFFEVLDRYVREKLEYEEDHLSILRSQSKALQDIRDRMPNPPSSGGSESGGGGGSRPSRSGDPGWTGGD